MPQRALPALRHCGLLFPSGLCTRHLTPRLTPQGLCTCTSLSYFRLPRLASLQWPCQIAHRSTSPHILQTRPTPTGPGPAPSESTKDPHIGSVFSSFKPCSGLGATSSFHAPVLPRQDHCSTLVEVVKITGHLTDVASGGLPETLSCPSFNSQIPWLKTAAILFHRFHQPARVRMLPPSTSQLQPSQ